MLQNHLIAAIAKLSAKLLLTSAIALSLSACQSTDSKDDNAMIRQVDEQLSLSNIYQDKAFKSEDIGQIRWLNDGSGYLAIETPKTLQSDDSKSNDKEIVQYDSATLARKVLVSAKQLTPTGAEQALKIDDYRFSDDRTKLLI